MVAGSIPAAAVAFSMDVEVLEAHVLRFSDTFRKPQVIEISGATMCLIIIWLF